MIGPTIGAARDTWHPGRGVEMALDVGRRRFAREASAARAAEGRPVPAVVIVGGGLSGLAMAMQLVRSGSRDFIIVEQSDGVGGTWREQQDDGKG